MQRSRELEPAGDPFVAASLSALNAELAAVNAELHRKVEELAAANRGLCESEARLARAEAIAHLGSWELDLTEDRLSWSDEVYRIFGLEPQAFGATYEAFLDAVHPDDRAAIDEAYAGSIRDGLDSYEIEHRVVRRTGELRIVHEKCEHVHDADGRIVRSVGMVHDVTELAQARLALEEADRRKSHFLAVLSHELRNPLAPIRNGLFVLGRAAPGSPQAARALAIIDRQVGHLSRLVEDLLDVTRITRGKIELRKERLDLAELVRRAAEDQAAVFAGHGLALAVSIAPVPIPILGDRTRVAQVVGNLLHNAAKFTPEGGRVEVEAGADLEAGEAVVRVRDSGVGIEPELLERIFEPFAQADATLDRSKGGLGLGLALSRSLMELHGGRVEAASAGPGRGAEFTLRFPLAHPAAAPA